MIRKVSPPKPRVSCIFQNLPVLCFQAKAEYTFREVFSLSKKYASLSLVLLLTFLLWTAAVTAIDIRPIGPNGSLVSFAGLNCFVHRLTGVHMALNVLTDWLSLIPVLVILGFGTLGLAQWIRRKSLQKVDRSLLVLGGFYGVTGAVYLFFEKVVVNHRPVLIEGILEASYPSSTTMLVICVMSTACLQLRERMRNTPFRKGLLILIGGFTVLMVIGRLLSGVHWVTDIIGGILLSFGLVALYAAITEKRDC